MKYILIGIALTGMFFNLTAQNNGSRLTDEQRREALTRHNKYRADVGTNPLVWSNELATEAQAWADKLAKKGCAFEHSKTSHGENLYWASWKSTATEAINSWAEEIKYYHGQAISYSNYSKMGHYTQMVWYNTTEVGCAIGSCKNGSTIWVCTYNPAGNYIGEKPYGNE
ncbi:MAG: CAP domain-containing protein [Bacteroidota bacterium]|nr:CAP domain-containing protein [Bacteroidota bacterium]